MSSPPAVSILSDHVCQLGEGPSYDPVGNRLWWFDIVACNLVEWEWPHGPARVHDLPEMASAIASIDDEWQLLVGETGLWRRRRADGALERHVALEADLPGNRSNDARVHPSGAFWIGTMGKAAEYGAGAIYWHMRGEIRRLYSAVTVPNAICFSPDGAAAYYTDTRQGILFRVACDPHSGLPMSEPSVLVDRRGMEGGIDGAVTDADGRLWNARWGAGALDAYAPDGRLLETIPIPARQSSCPAFAGPDADRIVVTSAWQGMDAAARAADPHAGKTFLVDTPVRGRLEPRAVA